MSLVGEIESCLLDWSARDVAKLNEELDRVNDKVAEIRHELAKGGGIVRVTESLVHATLQAQVIIVARMEALSKAGVMIRYCEEEEAKKQG